ncbi:GyrI-like domain-containing protein [Actinopolymorpha sp. B9G3]|uniref:AraC family transcriptional regulator n=1 Tax=Actinopolymorpha sp. B9G3 TaxID=3158970 RepID=UPI0032D9699F
MRFEVVDVAGMRLAGLGHRGPYERIRETYATLFPRLAALGLDQRPGFPLVAVYYDDPAVTPEVDLRSFAAVTVADGDAIGDLEELRLPGGLFLRGEVVGSHDLIGEAWGTLNEHLAASEYAKREAESFEIYVSNAPGVPDDRLRTDLYVPIA